MAIKIGDPRRWECIPVGEILQFDGTGKRTIRLDINAEAHAVFKAVYPDEKVVFLAAFQGKEVLEFDAVGPVEVWVTSEADVYFRTDEGRKLAFVNDGKVSFAKVPQRRTGSEQVMYMQGLALANLEWRNAQLEAFREAALARGQESEDDGRSGEGELPPGEEQPPIPDPDDAGTEGVAG